MNSQSITLPGGRRLAYAESGDSQGHAVIFFHGGPGSTLPMQPNEGAIAASLGVRLITVDRPGYGGSDPHPGRRLLDWPSDVRALVDHLGIARFSVIGFSAGSPYALACAARLTDRLTRVVIVGGGGPMYLPEVRHLSGWVWRVLFFISAYAPSVIRFMYRMLYNPKRSPEQVARQLTAALGPADQKLLAQPEILEPISAHFKAGMNRGLEPLAEDVIVTAQPWGFELEKIEVPIELWYGTADLAAPLSMGEHLKQHLPKATLHIVEGQGHLLIISRWRDILASAVGAHAVATEPT